MSSLNRRSFLKSSAATVGATFAISGTKSSGRILGANDRINVVVAGFHGRGQGHIADYLAADKTEIAYLVDPDSRLYDPTVKKIVAAGGQKPACVADVRTALDDPHVDAISIATPNHWHSLMTIWACEAGKDVYVEKPCSHNVHEGRIATEMARKHERIVQHGTQSRSSRNWDRIVQVVRSEHYGPLKVAYGLCHKVRRSIGFKSPKMPPAEVDFDLWLGPVRMQPYHENLVHYNWHWFWDTGNGDLGNQGVHQMDIARWGIKDATLPKSVVSVGGRVGYEDQGETANTQLAVFDFGEAQLIFEVRGLVAKNNVTNYFVTTEGTIKADGKFYPHNGGTPENIPDVASTRGPGKGHIGNFLAAVRSRNPQDLNADILEGHYSSSLCHLANISYRLAKVETGVSSGDVFAGNDAATTAMDHLRKHLTGDAGLKLDETPWRVGPRMEIDLAQERFAKSEHSDKANALLTRRYRAPFVVPDRVA